MQSFSIEFLENYIKDSENKTLGQLKGYQMYNLKDAEDMLQEIQSLEEGNLNQGYIKKLIDLLLTIIKLYHIKEAMNEKPFIPTTKPVREYPRIDDFDTPVTTYGKYFNKYSEATKNLIKGKK